MNEVLLSRMLQPWQATPCTHAPAWAVIFSLATLYSLNTCRHKLSWNFSVLTFLTDVRQLLRAWRVFPPSLVNHLHACACLVWFSWSPVLIRQRFIINPVVPGIRWQPFHPKPYSNFARLANKILNYIKYFIVFLFALYRYQMSWMDNAKSFGIIEHFSFFYNSVTKIPIMNPVFIADSYKKKLKKLYHLFY